jgi:isopentenyl phosphate kinase
MRESVCEQRWWRPTQPRLADQPLFEAVVVVTFDSLKVLVARFSTNPDVTSGLNDKLTAAAKAKTAAQRAHLLNAFANQVRAQIGKALTAEQAGILLELADALA